MTVMVMSRGDRLPNLVATLTGRDEVSGVVGPVDLTTATSITVKGVQNGDLVIDRVVTGNANGEVTLAWEAGDTDRVGYLYLRFVVLWPNGKEQTFPEEGAVRVRFSLDGPA